MQDPFILCRRHPRLREWQLHRVAREASQGSLRCRMRVAQSHHRIREAAAPRHLLMLSSNQHQHLVGPAAVATLQFQFRPPEGRVWQASKRQRPTRPSTRTTHYHSPQFLRTPLLHLSAQLPLSAASMRVSRCSLLSQCGAQGMVVTARKGNRWPWRLCCSMGSGQHPQIMCHHPPLQTTVPAGLMRSEADMVHYSLLLLVPAMWHPRLHRFKMAPTVPSSHSELHRLWTASPIPPVTVLENLRRSGGDW